MGRTESTRTRTVEEATSYAIGHRIRIEVLAFLNEGPRSVNELAKLTGVGLSRLGYHIKELADSGCIELARVEKVRNVDEHYYRAAALPFISDEEAEALPPEVKQEYAAVILRAIMAEGLAALWAGKLHSDPAIRMCWRWFNLDAQGRQELADEQRESWERIVDIEAGSVNRRTKSGEKATSVIVAMLGFERFRPTGESVSANCRFFPGKS